MGHTNSETLSGERNYSVVHLPTECEAPSMLLPHRRLVIAGIPNPGKKVEFLKLGLPLIGG